MIPPELCGPPWKSGPSGPRIPVKLIWALAPEVHYIARPLLTGLLTDAENHQD